jgi:hypothetical protein
MRVHAGCSQVRPTWRSDAQPDRCGQGCRRQRSLPRSPPGRPQGRTDSARRGTCPTRNPSRGRFVRPSRPGGSRPRCSRGRWRSRSARSRARSPLRALPIADRDGPALEPPASPPRPILLRLRAPPGAPPPEPSRALSCRRGRFSTPFRRGCWQPRCCLLLPRSQSARFRPRSSARQRAFPGRVGRPIVHRASSPTAIRARRQGRRGAHRGRPHGRRGSDPHARACRPRPQPRGNRRRLLAQPADLRAAFARSGARRRRRSQLTRWLARPEGRTVLRRRE